MRILITGCSGQIGTELTVALRNIYGNDQVIASDIKEAAPEVMQSGPFEILDVLDKEAMRQIIRKYQVEGIFHMAAILSAVGEGNPMLAWNVNMNGLINVLELGREEKVERILCPSSIAAFGPETPVDNTPQETVLRPTTMYGITKVAGELLCNYYVQKYGMDVRGLRYPGIISNATLPGGGTTDYAVAIYYDAVKFGKYECFVTAETTLPMMYMPDCLKATIDLFQAPKANLKRFVDYNVGSMSFDAATLAASIKRYIPEFEVAYKPDFHQAIADSWPNSVDDSAAREEWGWNPEYDLDAMTRDMLQAVKIKVEKGEY
ncbi:MAG: NAD-dependent epimerase/dehydratase family protein [Bacteroidales bacterium]|nr:NAD-dependent epimerase/dehydratase family protein [Bacteroidales bacterium]